jgi:hypothetical protein
VLVLATLALWPGLNQRASALRLVAWGGLHGLACLVRVEHLLVAMMMTALLLVAWRGKPSRDLAGRLAQVAGGFLVVLLPWHIEAWKACRAFNRAESLPPATARAFDQLETSLAHLEWC